MNTIEDPPTTGGSSIVYGDWDAFQKAMTENRGNNSADQGGGINNNFEKGNFNKVKDNYLKNNGIDAHELKKDYLEKKAPIAEYDIYVNKDTGELFMFKKGGKGAGIPTGEFRK